MANPTRRIWLVNLFFGTGAAPTGVLLESAAIGLRQAGYVVEALVGRSRYNAATAQSDARFAGKVHRIYCGGDTQGFTGRLISWLLYYVGVLFFVFSRRLPDAVVFMTTPPFMHLIFVARNWFSRRKARLILWNQDTYPEVLAAVAMISRESPVYRLLMGLERFGVSRVDEVIVLDRAMQRLLESHGGRRLWIVPNWELMPGPAGHRLPADHGAVMPRQTTVSLVAAVRREFRFLVLYTGNYGWGHDLSILWNWISNHRRQRDFFFLFVGGGPKWREIEQFVREHRPASAAVHGYLEKADVHALIAQADYGLVALQEGCQGLMSPSKIHGYLMLGKPLIYLGPSGSNVADAIERYQCGWRVAETDAGGLTRLLSELAAPQFDYSVWSRRAALAAAERYIEPVGVRDFLKVVDDACRPSTSEMETSTPPTFRKGSKNSTP